jgi:methionyl-tRNA synthetase
MRTWRTRWATWCTERPACASACAAGLCRMCLWTLFLVRSPLVRRVALCHRADGQLRCCCSCFALQQACEAALGAVKETNKYLTDKAPWHMKEDAHGKAVVVRSTLEAIYVAAHFLSPFIPSAAATIFARLATPARPITELSPGLAHLVPGTAVEAGDVLFTKFEPPQAVEVEKKERPVARAAPAADAPLDASRLEVRVGRVLSVEQHPGADHLFVETIDLGEPAPRTVVSGLVKFMAREQLLGARVVCVCNLKPAAMRGVVSQAMVLCASDAEHTQVELVVPPEGAPVGELVTFPGYPGVPDAQLNPKKKIWEAIQPELRTSGCEARYRDAAFTTSAGSCRVASIADGVIK